MRALTSRTRRCLVLGAACGLLAGCAALPSTGPVRSVSLSGTGTDGSRNVRLTALAPAADASPNDIVDGFLTAMAADDPGFQIARQYLTPDMAKRWDPNARTTVYNPANSSPTAEGDTVTITGTPVAHLDRDGYYQSAATNDTKLQAFPFHLSQDRQKQWRIDHFDDGTLVSKADFNGTYVGYTVYFINPNNPSYLVPSQVYLRPGTDSGLSEVVSSLLSGAPPALSEVVAAPMPNDVSLVSGPVIRGDQASVTLSPNATEAPVQQRNEFARLLLATLRAVPGGPVVDSVQVHIGSLVVLANKNDLGPPPRQQATPYYVTADGRLSAVGGPVVDISAPGGIRQAAVGFDRIAWIGNGDPRTAYVKLADVPSAKPVRVYSADPGGGALTELSWDGSGDLWMLQGDDTIVRATIDDTGNVVRTERIQIPMVTDRPTLTGRPPSTVVAFAIAGDGVHVALAYAGDVGVEVGVVSTSGDTGSITLVQRVLATLTQVRDVTWADEQRLAVVGTTTPIPSGAVTYQIYRVFDDGSPVLSPDNTPVTPFSTPATQIAALGSTLFGSDGTTIYNYRDTLGWSPVGPGSHPVFAW